MIIGPSHVVRWERLKSFFDIGVDFYGLGGLPIWHEKVLSLSEGRSPFIMVGDFRFGNSFHLTGNERDAFVVKKELITPDVDRFMFDASMRSLDQLKRNDIRLVFWCLLIREYKNIQEKRYFNNGFYRHPIWNLSEIEGRYPNSVKLSDILSQNLDFLFIDSSNHPSIFGFYFLKKIYQGLTPDDALLATLKIKQSFFNIYRFFGNEKIITSGTNSSFRLLKDYLSRGVLDAACLRNFHVREADEALFSAHKYHKSLIFFAKEEDSKLDIQQLTFFDKAPYENKLLIVKKGCATYFYSSTMHEKPRLSFILNHQEEEEEIVGDVYNLIGFSQVLYYALSILKKEGYVESNPYRLLKTLVTD